MNKLLVIASAAALCIPITGCNEKNDSQWTGLEVKIKSIEEVSSGTTTLTSYQWTEDGAPAGETHTSNGIKIYEDSEYSYDGTTVTYTRTSYLDGAISGRQKRIAEYTPGWYSVKTLSVYDPETAVTPTEQTRKTFDSYGRITKYEYEFNGMLMRKEDGYVYSDIVKYNIWDYSTVPTTQTTSTTVYTSGLKDYTVITSASGEEIEFTRFSYTGGPTYIGYKTYRIVDGKDVLAEAQTNYSMSTDYTKETYDTTWYEDDGQTVKSRMSTTRMYNVSTVVIPY